MGRLSFCRSNIANKNPLIWNRVLTVDYEPANRTTFSFSVSRLDAGRLNAFQGISAFVKRLFCADARMTKYQQCQEEMLNSKVTNFGKLLLVPSARDPAASLREVGRPFQIPETVKLLSFGRIFEDDLYLDQASSSYVSNPDWDSPLKYTGWNNRLTGFIVNTTVPVVWFVTYAERYF